MTDLALRVPKSVRVGGRTYDTVAEHSAVVHAKGEVAFAKFGRCLSASLVTRLNSMEAARPPRLIMVYRADDEFYGFAATLGKAVRLTDTEELVQSLFPDYYTALIDEAVVEPPKSYLILTSSLKPVGLHKFTLATNGRPLLNVLGECRTSVMLVDEQT